MMSLDREFLGAFRGAFRMSQREITEKFSRWAASIGFVKDILREEGWGPGVGHEFAVEFARALDGADSDLLLHGEIIAALTELLGNRGWGLADKHVSALRTYLQGGVEKVEMGHQRAFVSHVVGLFEDAGWSPPEKVDSDGVVFFPKHQSVLAKTREGRAVIVFELGQLREAIAEINSKLKDMKKLLRSELGKVMVREE